jgi:ubiquinone/menaquinone biosynthesis C-methylase UbiE
VSYRVKLALFVLSAVLVVFVLDTAYEGLKTLNRLDVVESQRDQWQRPSDIIQALNLKQGSTAVDLGCGSGYFALKLSSAVGSGGTVYAVDVRRLPLIFLWFRALIRHQRNLRTMLGESDNSHLPSGAADAVLIANTYHELASPVAMLYQVFQSLVHGGRLVIVDPMQTEHGELSPILVEHKLRGGGFDIVSRDDEFINQPVRGRWWLIIARRP